MTPKNNKQGGEKIIIVTPPVATSNIDLDLVSLTEYLVKNGNDDGSGGGYGLGGEFGYGIDFENEVFIMHHYCWCEREDECLWCMMNDPKENKNYNKMKKELVTKFNSYWRDWGGAPTFFYKPTKTGCRWYKWIGRDTEWDKEPTPREWKKIYQHCIKSLTNHAKTK